jgi:hypothetical protein
MKNTLRILINLACLACAFGVFFLITLILAEDLAMPAWMPFDYHEGSWLALFLRLFGVVLITPPAVALLYSVMRLGADQSRGRLFQDPHETYMTLRLPVGVKIAAMGLGLGIVVAVITVLVWQKEPWGIWIFASPLIILGVYCMMVFSLIRVDFDQEHIIAMTPLFRWQRHRWADLVNARHHHQWQELRLTFTDGRVARVSTLFNNLPDFVAFMQVKAKEIEDARTARS